MTTANSSSGSRTQRRAQAKGKLAIPTREKPKRKQNEAKAPPKRPEEKGIGELTTAEMAELLDVEHIQDELADEEALELWVTRWFNLRRERQQATDGFRQYIGVQENEAKQWGARAVKAKRVAAGVAEDIVLLLAEHADLKWRSYTGDAPTHVVEALSVALEEARERLREEVQRDDEAGTVASREGPKPDDPLP